MSNTNLHNAKRAKNDEFYTQLEDIEKELSHYTGHFKDKVVYCNCDDPEWSNFWKYFHMNFEALGLKKLISTHYDNTEPVYKMEYTGGDDNDIEFGVKTLLEGNGDFRNQECIDILDECDIVVTNPPFSLFREYVACLMEHGKKFLIIGNMNAITYKEIFPLIREDKMRVESNKCGKMYFTVPDDFTGKTIDVNGVPMAIVPARWFTNLDNKKHHEKLILWKNYTSEEYPKYDNYDAINVNKVSEIPVDYDGVMGVPISFLDKYNPEQFEIVAFRKGDDGKDLVFTREREREREFNRTFVSLYDVDCRDDKKCRRKNQWEAYLRENNNQTEIEPIDFFYPMSMGIGGCMNSPKDTMINGKKKYARLLIRKKSDV